MLVTCASPDVEPRGTDVLYEVIEGHLDAFLDAASQQGRRVPGYVVRELSAYLECGIASFGFALLRCSGCHHAEVVAFSCKRRGFCPSCGGRRMSQTAANLVDKVFPEVGVRQWVLTLPMVGSRCVSWS